MKLYSENVNLAKDTLNYSLSCYFPVVLAIDPANLYGNGTTNKIRKIVYKWPDGTSDTNEFKPTLENNSWLQFPEFGNPLNYPTDKTLYLSKEDAEITLKNINVECFYFGTKNTTTYNIQISAFKPKIEGFRYQDVYDEINLLDARMFGPDNTLLYVFETRNPNYILMSTVNWKLLPEEIINKKLPPIRPYKFLLPFDKTKEVGFKYEDVPFVKTNPSQNSMDSGGGYI